MATADQAVAIFDSFVGTTENPPHSNRTRIGAEFGWNGVAWCAETCSVVLNRAFGRVILWTASVAQAIADAKAGKNGMRWHPKGTARPRKGWLCCFDFGGRGDPGDFHISMVRDPGTGSKWQTDGGNEGDAVRQQWRDDRYLIGFIEIPYDDDATPAPTPSEEDDDMKGFLCTHNGEIIATDGLTGVHIDDPGAGSLGYYTGFLGYRWKSGKKEGPSPEDEVTGTFYNRVMGKA